MESKTFVITSSNGTIVVEKASGKIVENNCDAGEYTDEIGRFDIDEYLKYFGLSEVESRVDILCFCYWNLDGSYELAENDWRVELKTLRNL
jgi:hypothetical protein